MVENTPPEQNFERAFMADQTPEFIERNKSIGEQNDRFRQTWGADFTIPGRIVFTRAAADLPPAWQVGMMQAVQTFDQFDEDNDPYLFRDFGAFEVTVDDQTETFFWKIDLYDTSYTYGSETPEDVTKTRRVLTIMLRSDY